MHRPCTVTHHESAQRFLDAAGAHLQQLEALHNLPLGIVRALVDGRTFGEDAEILLTAHDEAGAVVAVLVCTPPFKPILSAGDRAGVLALGDHWKRHVGACNGAVGPQEQATAFIHGVAPRGFSVRTELRMGVYELREPTPPPAVAGHARRSTEGDVDVLIPWVEAMRAELAMPFEGTARDDVERRTSAGDLWVWQAPGGALCAMAASVRKLPRGESIAMVYTPPDKRGRGFAGNVVHALGEAILASGRDYVCLFTDLANPTSNALYERLGYVRVGTNVSLALDEPSA